MYHPDLAGLFGMSKAQYWLNEERKHRTRAEREYDPTIWQAFLVEADLCHVEAILNGANPAG